MSTAPSDMYSQQAKIGTAKTWLTQNPAVAETFSIEVKASLQRVEDSKAKLLKSLSFPEIYSRYYKITEAESETFEWIYTRDKTKPNLWSNFSEWLANNDPKQQQVYWISGKPGSGKSTLMRFLNDNQKTLSGATNWTGSCNLVIASCYFWNSGTRLQKSQEGLFQTLLYQLLTQLPDFQLDVFSSVKYFPSGGPDPDHLWSISQLRTAIFALLTFYQNSCKFLLFIDGLDEFQGNEEQRQEVCTLIHDLSNVNDVKICVASRPWNIYQDNFGRNSMLRLQDLTKKDIKTFVAHKSESNKYFIRWKAEQPVQSSQFMETIVEKAQGVFLWVRLVLQSLLTGLRNSDDASDLNRRLNEIPADLEQYFRKMLDNLDTFYRERASQAFQFALSGTHLLLAYYNSSSTSQVMIPENATTSQLHQCLARIEQNIDRQVNAWCMGLLESRITSVNGPHTSLQLREVDFLHRTARDFILNDEIRTLLMPNVGKRNENNIALFAAYTKFCQDHPTVVQGGGITLKRTLILFSVCPLTASRDVDDHIFPILDGLAVELSKKTTDSQDATHSSRTTPDPNVTFWALAIDPEFGVPAGYVEQYFLRERNLPPKAGRPLLDYALGVEGPNFGEAHMVRVLLGHGADPAELYKGQSIWDRYLAQLDIRPKSPFQHTVVMEPLMSQSVRNLWTDWKKTPGAKDPMEVLKSLFYADEMREILESEGYKLLKLSASKSRLSLKRFFKRNAK